MKDKIYVTGEIIDGRGKASGQINKHLEELNEKLEFSPYLGSLNLVSKEAILFASSKAIVFNNGRKQLWPVRIQDLNINAYVYRWNKCPLHIFEIIADRKIRDHIHSKKTLTLEIDTINIITLSWAQKIGHFLLWHKRLSWYYSNDFYIKNRLYKIIRKATHLRQL